MTTRPRFSARHVRWIVQSGIVAVVAYVGIRHQVAVGGAPPLDSYCPFGAIETLPALLGGNGLIGKVGTSNLVLLGSVMIVTLALGASFCGWLCPFGAIQDLLGAGRRRVLGRSFVIPERLHRILRWGRWVVLGTIVWMSARVLGLWFADYDPFRAFFHFRFESWIAIALIAGTIVGGLLVERFWCLYLCPLGAVVGALGVAGLTKVRRTSEGCTDCSLCSRSCPSRIQVHRTKVVRDQSCTMCGECVEACPRSGALSMSAAGEGESLRPVAIGVATVLLFFALVGTGYAMGWWRTASSCAACTAQAPAAIEQGYNVVVTEPVKTGPARDTVLNTPGR